VAQQTWCPVSRKSKVLLAGLSEADEAQIEGYLDELLSLLPVLGVNAFESAAAESTGERVYLMKAKECDARGIETNSGFAVLSGSLVREIPVPSMKKHCGPILLRREQMIEDGVIVKTGKGLRFSVDYEFSSPSLAAVIVLGRNANGRVEWKDVDGISLKAHQEREAEA
jgi:hypothetical protein